MRILFFGDSITDCGRDRKEAKSLGNGYVKVLADKLRPIYPDMLLEIINKGNNLIPKTLGHRIASMPL